MTPLGAVVLAAWITAGIVLIVLGLKWYKGASNWMLRSLAILVAVVGAAYLIMLAVALGFGREPWNAMLVLLVVAVVIAAFIFWVSVLADCLLNEPSDGMGKLVWVLAIVLTFVIGAAIYHFGRRPRRLLEPTK